ncbi:ABC transporter permease [Sphaerobacter thermophilus]|uniref:Ornithine carbamoyltransferase n=1 Tax=Sphaerobacter thermophilus (strain ATCC 49802 / DSM 20745 / KCCM 41009 / NCIMB 13125 / S 6022) TaxID=479434 RepID=D1C396_SPHTD|nr:ABC transporter permease [Sphaerobacter thermophilus]ACZ38713.1 Ornithine carbamoyltransferase [Sphaerobacter thermophilus DSM 20745]
MTTSAPALEKAAQTAAARPRRIRLGPIVLQSHLALTFIFLYAPILILVIFSFNAARQQTVWTGFTFDWYAQMVQDAKTINAAKNSAIIAVISTAVSTVIGTLTALALDRYRFRGRTAFEGAMYLPIIVPEIVMAIALLVFFNFGFGLLEQWTKIQLNFGLGTITVAHIAFSFPFVAVVVRARLADFDRRLEEAAKDLGANEWQTFRRVTLPLLMPGILAGALLAFTLSIDDFVITFFTAGVGSTTLPLEIYGRVRRGVTPEVNAISTVLLLASIALVLGSTLLQRKR